MGGESTYSIQRMQTRLGTGAGLGALDLSRNNPNAVTSNPCTLTASTPVYR
jgi:hypothetical protein